MPWTPSKVLMMYVKAVFAGHVLNFYHHKCLHMPSLDWLLGPRSEAVQGTLLLEKEFLGNFLATDSVASHTNDCETIHVVCVDFRVYPVCFHKDCFDDCLIFHLGHLHNAVLVWEYDGALCQ